MLLLNQTKRRRSAASPPALVTRGIVWGTDFTQGVDNQILYGTIAGSTISAVTGYRGSSAGDTSNDPTWVAAGAQLNGGSNQHFRIEAADCSIFNYIQQTGVFTVYIKLKCTSLVIYDVSNAGQTIGSYAGYSNGLQKLRFHLGPNAYFASATSSQVVNNSWHTIAFVGNGTTVRFFVDSTEIGSGVSIATHATALTNRMYIGLDYGGGATTGTFRAMSFHNVAHTDQEVADQQTYFDTFAIA